MAVLVDTSAFYAMLDRADANHVSAADEWRRLLGRGTLLLTHNYIVVEAAALVQNRLGTAALRHFLEDLLAPVRTEWMDQERHQKTVDLLLPAGRRKLSLVDCASFVVMRELGIREAFCFDAHFREAGFQVLP